MTLLLKLLFSIVGDAFVEPIVTGDDVYTPAFVITPLATLFCWGYLQVLRSQVDE